MTSSAPDFPLQNPGPVVTVAVALAKAGVLRRCVYHDVANDSGKNLRECVGRRIDGGDEVRRRGGGLVLRRRPRLVEEGSRGCTGTSWCRRGWELSGCEEWGVKSRCVKGRGDAQAGGPLGKRLTEACEWAGVLEQVAALGWTRLDLRCRAAPRTPHSPAEGDPNTVIVCMILCLPPSLQDSLFHSLVQLGLQIRVILSCYDVGQPFSQWSSIGQRCG